MKILKENEIILGVILLISFLLYQISINIVKFFKPEKFYDEIHQPLLLKILLMRSNLRIIQEGMDKNKSKKEALVGIKQNALYDLFIYSVLLIIFTYLLIRACL